MTTQMIGIRVTVADGLYDGVIVDQQGERITVELDAGWEDAFDVLPDNAWISNEGRVQMHVSLDNSERIDD